MGTSGSMPQIPALANKRGNEKVAKAWVGLKAAIRFNLVNNGLWSSVRSEREPWRSRLHNAAADFEREEELASTNVEELENTEQYMQLLRGSLPPEGGRRNGSEVWVFISSTFTDTMVERDLLLMDAYPYIRDYCRQIGLDFNVVDFRWGIRQGASNRHTAAEICFQEVQRCRDTSVGPTFVAILGDKYGYRPIPPKLSRTNFLQILNYLEKEDSKESLEGVDLLKEWYQEDTNSLGESEYLLQPIDSKLKNYFSLDANLAQSEKDEWYRIFAVLQTCIFRAVRYSNMDPQFVKDTTQSITEGEIHVGLEGMSSLQEGHKHPRCFTFTRSITGLDESQKHARSFIDSGGPQQLAEKQRKLGELKDVLTNTLPEDALYQYSIRYLSTKDEMVKDEKNKDTLRAFCDKFCDFMVNSIKSYAITALQNSDNVLYNEVLHHNSFCRDRAASVIGQEVLLKRVMGYLSQAHATKPFVLHGIGGSGKTSVLAKLFTQSLEKYQGVHVSRPIHLIRFIGLSPQSSNIRDLLHSICEQLCVCFGINEGLIPQGYKQLETMFWQLLDKSSVNRPVNIFLDSLDQLSDEDQGRDLLWLPRQLPEHVHMVVTVRPDAGFALSAIKNLINNMSYFWEIKPLTELDKLPMVECLLSKNARTLTKDQKKVVLKAHQDNKPTALYMKIACDMASKWNSYTPLAKCKIAGNITGIITQLFEELEEKHGMLFVAHALGYLTCSRSGLTSNELLDILSCDDTVLEDVFEHFVPPLRRLPPLLWTRLRLDLGDYLVESGADNVVVYRWYHRIFFEVAHARYVEPNQKQLHLNIADYFMERWAHTPKPFVDKRTKKVDIAFRQVQTQPLVLDAKPKEAHRSLSATVQVYRSQTKTAGPRYNLRKLTELPEHLIGAQMWDEVEKVMCSIPWIEAKCRTGRMYQLLLELATATDQSDYKSAKVKNFYAMVRSNAQIIQQNPELITQQALNEPDSSACCKVATDYLKTNNTNTLCWQSLSKSQIQNAEVMTLTHTAPVFLVQFSPKGKFLATACTDNTVRIWMVASGSLEVTIETTALKIIFPPTCNWVAILESKSISIYGVGQGGLSKGKLLRRITANVEPTKAEMFVTSNSKHLYLYSLGTLTIYNAVSGKIVQKTDMKCRAKEVAFSSDGKLMAIAYKNIYLWDISAQKQVKDLEMDWSKNDLTAEVSLAFSKDNKTVAGVLSNGTYRWHVKGPDKKFFGHKLSLNCHAGMAVFSPNLDFVISLTQRDEAEILRLKDVQWCRQEGHKAPITCAHFCQFCTQYGILATGSEDHTVRLWDTNHINGFVIQPKIKLRHDGPVTGCFFSPDGSKAVTSSKGQECIMWDLNQSVPQPIKILCNMDRCETDKVVCLSEDGNFVIASCNRSDFCIWNMKTTPSTSYKHSIQSHHRLIPYVDPHYLLVTFNQIALACFTTTNKQGYVFLYELMSAPCIEDWRNHPDETPMFNGYTSAIKEFYHGANFQITAAALSPTEKRLATLAVKTSEDSLQPVFSSPEANDYLSNPPVLRVWDVSEGTPLAEMELNTTMTRFHQIQYMGQQLVIFMHMKWQDALNTHGGSRRSARLRRKIEQQQQKGEALVQVLDPSGETVFKEKYSGSYDNLSITRAQFIDSKSSAKVNAGRMFLSCVKDGVLITKRVGDQQVVGKFREKNDDVTAYDLSPDNTRAIVGVDDGTVHVLRIVSGANL